MDSNSHVCPCPCGQGGLLIRTTQKQGENHKRKYLKCPASDGGEGCGFFSFLDELKLCDCGRGYCRNEFKKDGKKYWVCPLKGKGTGTDGCSFQARVVVRQPPPATMSTSIATTSQRATGTPPTTPFHPSEGTPPTTPYSSSTPTSTDEKLRKALAKALAVSQTANKALVDILQDLALDDK